MAKPRTRTPPAADRLDWRPQVPGVSSSRRSRARNPVIEPLWEGDHVLAHFEAGTSGHPGFRLQLIDEDGDDLTERAGDLCAEIGGAVRAADAVIDGYLTRQATRPGETVDALDGPRPIGIATTLLGIGSSSTRQRLPAIPEGDLHLGPLAFVAVDLLRIDGEDLFDVPLLERKRILDSIIVEAELVRATPFTQPPAEPWIRSWKAAGFAGIVMKAANSRYEPGARTDEWQIARGRD